MVRLTVINGPCLISPQTMRVQNEEILTLQYLFHICSLERFSSFPCLLEHSKMMLP